MNLIYLKYAVEVAACGSINKAAEKLYIGQPNLSRAIKDLESSLGVAIFGRSSKGMEITPEGEIFLGYAKSILKQVDAVEGLFRDGASAIRFSLAAPRVGYISEAFASFTATLPSDRRAKLRFIEDGDTDAIRHVLSDDFRLGIIRYPVEHDKYYKTLLEEKHLDYELLFEFESRLIVSRESPLAKLPEVTPEALEPLMEIVQTDAEPFALSDPKRGDGTDEPRRRLIVTDRASRLKLLSVCPDTYIWTSPAKDEELEVHGLISLTCAGEKKLCKDVIIHEESHRLSEFEKRFISELCRVKRHTLQE